MSEDEGETCEGVRREGVTGSQTAGPSGPASRRGQVARQKQQWE